MFLLPVHHVRVHAEGIFEIALERRGYRFTPGESAVLYNDGADSRPYSLASAPDEDVLCFLVRRITGGAVSEWLAARRPGDGVRISTPFGHFRPGQAGGAGDPAVFVATGVGIAPFLSFLRSERSVGDGAAAAAAPSARPRPVCFYGVRYAREAVGMDLLGARTALRLAVSREAPPPGCHHGRVTDLLDAVPLAAGTQYYLCGLDAMVDAVARWLDARGVGPERVHTEVFFSADERR